ncbi:MAG: polyprenyl synthetase family protein [Anaerolineales bacterium]|nr:polyprenyl synthetase family protein [Anaerolineales bacterium]
MNTTIITTSIQEQIRQVEDLMRAQGENCNPDMRAALDHLLSAGGKRIRPTLTLLVGGMLDGPPAQLVTLSAAAQLLHTATLVHDDLIDGALLRRGAETLNARWSSAATVLTGDFLFARAAKLAADVNHLPLTRLFAETLAVIVNGELTQLFSARGVINRENYYQRIYAKTASMFEMAAQAAAIISVEDAEIRETIRKFGYELGMAFQIVDDLLDFTGDQAAVGKPLGSDLLQGLVTLPAIYYAETNPDHPDVRSLAAGGWGDHERMERLVQSIRASDAIRQAMREAEQRVDSAVACLAPFDDREERAALENLARYVVDRKI